MARRGQHPAGLDCAHDGDCDQGVSGRNQLGIERGDPMYNKITFTEGSDKSGKGTFETFCYQQGGTLFSNGAKQWECVIRQPNPEDMKDRMLMWSVATVIILLVISVIGFLLGRMIKDLCNKKIKARAAAQRGDLENPAVYVGEARPLAQTGVARNPQVGTANVM